MGNETPNDDPGTGLAPHGLDVTDESSFRTYLRRRFVARFGVRPIHVPRGVRWLIRRSGFSRRDLRAICAEMRTASDWAPAWERYATRLHDAGHDHRAGLALHWSQYMLGPTDPNKLRLRSLAEAWYLARSDVGDASIVRSATKGYTSSLLVQRDRGVPGGPVAVIVPGLFDSKERNHALAARLHASGVTVALFELDDVTMQRGLDPTGLLEILPRALDDLCVTVGVDHEQVHLLGICLGGFYTYHAAARRPVGSVTIVSGVADVTAYARHIPANAFETLLSREIVDATDDTLALVARGAVDEVVDAINAPAFLHHGLMDSMVPAKDSYRIANLLGERAKLALHAFDLHGCPRSFRSISAEFEARIRAQGEEATPRSDERLAS